MATFFIFTAMKHSIVPALCACILAFAACKDNTVRTERSTVNPAPVETYQEIVQSETTDTFRVALYETKFTFKYVISISYKGLEATDSLRIPNLGYAPKPEIRQGAVRPSCIVGFLDDKQQFMEGNEVRFEDNKLKFHTLKTYDVTTE